MMPLPTLMVAPNGARKTKADHPNLPMTLDEIVTEAIACHTAGADGLHLHVRDENGAHSLDAGLYTETLAELHKAVPNMALQITTEAVGRYSPAQQRDVVKRVQPAAVSIALSEMYDASHPSQAISFYTDCQQAEIAVQHILYGADDLALMGHLLAHNQLAQDDLQLLFVLGRYTENQQSTPEDLDPFVQWHTHLCPEASWGICAFGANETRCLAAAHHKGGVMRIGFENAFENSDGTIANSNAERVWDLKSYLKNNSAAS